MQNLTEIEAKENLGSLIDDTAQSHEPIQIRGKHSSAVLISEDDWRAVQETLYVVSVPGMRESIIEGMKTPLEDCSENLDG